MKNKTKWKKLIIIRKEGEEIWEVELRLGRDGKKKQYCHFNFFKNKNKKEKWMWREKSWMCSKILKSQELLIASVKSLNKSYY